jgi:hypothetical protein
MSQHVFYAYDPNAEPTWAYSSFPVACFGMAGDFHTAQADYREAYTLGTEDIADTPDSIEHYEQRHASGVWVRVRIGPDTPERERVAMVLFGALSQSPQDGAAQIGRWTQANSGEPTVIACLPTDTIGFTIGEIDDQEAFAVALAFPDPVHRRDLVWIGGLARGMIAGDEPIEPISETGLTSSSTMEEFMEATGVTRESLGEGVVGRRRPLLVA